LYAVLQQSLEQTISRADLEEASLAAPSVTRADCALLQRELFGVVVGNLPRAEALALQAALRARNFPTDVVPQAELPELPEAQRAEAMNWTASGVSAVDLYGREECFARDRYVFAAGGRVRRLRSVPEQKMEWVVRPGPRGSVSRQVAMVTESRLKDVPEFRVELFLSGEPYRVQWVLTEDSVLRVNGEVRRLRDGGGLNRLLARVAALLPVERVNQGILRAITGTDFVYPSVRAFEEEIVWSFYRLMAEDSGPES
jgi:hypothetical protein